MKSFVIVAVPRESDYVWKVSSEKIPHLTILYGALTDDMSAEQMTLHVEHVVKTSLNRFGMDVQKRGELGALSADVLFFDHHNRKMLNEVRSYFLVNDDIRKGYDSVEQFPNWTPHLTLGYPETPAKPDTRDYPGFSWVDFDRIAIWFDDFDGPMFDLQSFDPYIQNQEGEMSMSEEVTQFLAHFGVKGMKWGDRKSTSKATKSGGSDHSSDDHANASAAKAKAKKTGVKSLSNKELQDMITRMNLEQQYVKLAPPSKGAVILRKGGQVVGEILLGVGKSQATKALNDQATKLIGAALKR